MFNPKWKHAIAFSAVLAVNIGRGLAAPLRSHSSSKSALPLSPACPVAHGDPLKRHQYTAGHFINRRTRLGFINSPLSWVSLSWIGTLRGGGTGLSQTSHLIMKTARPKKGASVMVLISILSRTAILLTLIGIEQRARPRLHAAESSSRSLPQLSAGSCLLQRWKKEHTTPR